MQHQTYQNALRETIAAQVQAIELTEEELCNKDLVIRKLYERYWDNFISYTATYLPEHSDCEEIVQELFIHIYQKLATLSVKFSFDAYLRASLRNRIYNYLRDGAIYKKHSTSDQLRKSEDSGNNVETYMNHLEVKHTVNSFLKTIPQKYAEVYVLNKLYGLSIKKTSVKLNRPVATVERHLRKSLLMLKEYISTNNN